MKTLLMLLCCLALAVPAVAVEITEIRIDHGGSDTDEYFELAGSPGEMLDGLAYIVIGDGATGSGTIESVVLLDGLYIGDDGYFAMGEATFSGACGALDATGELNFENSDNVTHMLVAGFSGESGIDVDEDDDGVMDITPWNGIVDSVALLEEIGGGDLVYSDNQVGPDGTYVPAHVLKCVRQWNIGMFDLCAYDTPGASNEDICAVPTEDTSFGSLKAMYQ